MALIPSMLLKRLYTFGSLENKNGGVTFAIKNRLSDAELTELISIQIDGQSVPNEKITLDLGNGETTTPAHISGATPLSFPLRKIVNINIDMPELAKGKHIIELAFQTKPFGKLKFSVDDAISKKHDIVRIPRDEGNDYNPDIIKARQDFVAEQTDTELRHIRHYSLDPATLGGNIENFGGVAQIPIGFAGPLKVNGEHAKGDFLIPLATTEGTLVASYNRGIKLLNLSGGVTTTIIGDAMQRAPVFVFKNARDCRAFKEWVDANTDKIREEAEATSSVAKLQYIDSYLSNKFVYLRFNYSTGDAAGQNMVGRATFAACGWILDHYQGIEHFYLESNFATDKKASQINVMRTRGKRVVAEATVPRDVLIQNMRVEPESLAYHNKVANVGAFLSGANNNGAHSANGITAMFIATGQDVANVSESSAGVLYTELTPENDLYINITIPSLIVRHLRGRHKPGHPARMPRHSWLRGPGQGEQAGRDHCRCRSGRRTFPRFGNLFLRLGFQPRAVRAQSLGKACLEIKRGTGGGSPSLIQILCLLLWHFYLVCPAKAILDTTILNAGQFIKQMLGYRTRLIVVDDVFIILEAELANGSNDSCSATTEHFGYRPCLQIRQHIVDINHRFLNLVAEISSQLQDRVTGNAGQDAAGQRRRHDLLTFIDEADVHRPHFLDIALFDGV